MSVRVQDEPEPDRRRAERFAVKLGSVLIESKLYAEHAAIINVARLGFLARTRLKYTSGNPISVNFPTLGKLEAMVVWSERGMLGARFHEPVPEVDFARFLKQIDSEPV